jgi:hypothetical protein
MRTIDEIEREMIDASAEIGLIHESNCHFTYGLARIIWELGKPVEDLTVRELLVLHRQYKEAFNSIHAMEQEEVNR